MYVRALNEINHGGFLKMKGGECREIDNNVAKHLILLGVMEENKVSHKKIKIKDVTIDEGSAKRSKSGTKRNT